MDAAPDDLPYVDAHTVSIAAPRARVWDALTEHAGRHLTIAQHALLASVLGPDPPGGFAIVGMDADEQLVLAGRHRFSRYQLTFTLADEGDATSRTATRLTATTHAAFPGWRGQVYRTLVIRSRLHVVATRRILRAIERACDTRLS